MDSTINAKRLRASLPQVVARVRRGARFTVLYRSRPALQIVPVNDVRTPRAALDEESLSRAGPVGRARDERSAAAGLRKPLADSYIAAAARRHGLTVVTGNDRDFRRPGMNVFNPFDESTWHSNGHAILATSDGTR